MAQKIQVILVDDIDGGEAEETISFALDGVSYEIDLSAKNAKKLRDAVAPYVAEARKARGARRRSSGGSAKRRASGSSSASEIREWARENGYEVSERGRVSEELRAAYEAAQ
ncbi:Lsr2 family protein [Mumia zhuanghuii]|uniref:Lsr2 family protein n=2 Tax=Mumia TaxID=1546255 RepID=A0A5Q6S1Y5_9ACTN|nr:MULTISPECIES: Lsr2 family protein [Mumia]KAA1418070.1 Lsr2 family protein [Mumia zhuanghuii]KAA1424375.1 Lsr2 family protein [Mumia zhuanghuii]